MGGRPAAAELLRAASSLGFDVRRDLCARVSRAAALRRRDGILNDAWWLECEGSVGDVLNCGEGEKL